jgi:cardiolipin synthase (CMP-forming)
MSLPNILTLIRILLIPLFVILIINKHLDWALFTFAVAGITDGLDGLIARLTHQRTELGAYLDPIADKLLMTTSYLELALHGKIRWWLTILVLGRDVLMLVAAAVILITVGYRPFPPTVYGKVTTFLEILLIFLVLLLAIWDNHALWMVREVCGFLVAAFVILSGFHYAIVVAHRLHTGE